MSLQDTDTNREIHKEKSVMWKHESFFWKHDTLHGHHVLHRGAAAGGRARRVKTRKHTSMCQCNACARSPARVRLFGARGPRQIARGRATVDFFRR